MVGEITIREYEVADTAAASELFEQGMLDYTGPETPAKVSALMRKWTGITKANFFSDVSTRLHAQNGGRMFVAVNNGAELVGTVALQVSDSNLAENSAELVRMSVREAERRCGVGKMLLDYAIAYCKERLKAKTLLLYTGEFMKMAVNFYSKHGFTIDPEYQYVSKSFEPGEADIIKMIMSLQT